MVLEETKKEVKVDNSAFRDRFRFLFSANDNIVCERFFKINYFNNASVFSEELGDTIRTISDRIQRDMESKSRIHTYYTTPGRVKLTGFTEDGKGFSNPNATYFDPPKETLVNNGEENEELKPYDITFKFDFQMAQTIETNPEDGKPSFSNYKSIYAVIWDGTVYPKDVRNSVDLSNSMAQYRNTDLTSMSFVRTLNYRMILGKSDLIYDSIKRICDTTSGEGKSYTNHSFYGTGKKYLDKDLVGLEPYNNYTYTIYVKPEGELFSKPVECPVYVTIDNVYVAKKPDGTYSELVKYDHDYTSKRIKSWENKLRDKTEAYRKSCGFKNTFRRS